MSAALVEKCRDCNGTGWGDDTEIDGILESSSCLACDGSGKVELSRWGTAMDRVVTWGGWIVALLLFWWSQPGWWPW